MNCVDWIERAIEKGGDLGADGAVVMGIRGAHVVTSPVSVLLGETDLKKRRWKNAWWMELSKLVKVMAKYSYRESE